MKTTPEYVSQLVDSGDPDGYWKCKPGDRVRYIETITPHDLAELRRLHVLHDNPLFCLISSFMVSLYPDFNAIFMLQHQPENWGKSWEEIYPQEKVIKMSELLKNFGQAFSVYPTIQQIVLKIEQAIHSSTKRSHKEIGKDMGNLSLQLVKEGLPILLFPFDDFLSKQDEATHLEPNGLWLAAYHQYDDLVQEVFTTVDRFGGGKRFGETYMIIAKLLGWAGGWSTATKGYGMYINPFCSILIPSLYKYLEQVKHAASYFNVEMNTEDVYRCAVRFLAGHEYGHKFGSEERKADRVAIPSALYLATKHGELEVMKQLVFMLIETAIPLTMKAMTEYEEGYHASSILSINAALKTKLLVPSSGLWRINFAQADVYAQEVLDTPEDTSDHETILHADHGVRQYVELLKLF